jgi:hypothetical protein
MRFLSRCWFTQFHCLSVHLRYVSFHRAQTEKLISSSLLCDFCLTTQGCVMHQTATQCAKCLIHSQRPLTSRNASRKQGVYPSTYYRKVPLVVIVLTKAPNNVTSSATDTGSVSEPGSCRAPARRHKKHTGQLISSCWRPATWSTSMNPGEPDVAAAPCASPMSPTESPAQKQPAPPPYPPPSQHNIKQTPTRHHHNTTSSKQCR